MMKRYKLLKDLPGIVAGSTFVQDGTRFILEDFYCSNYFFTEEMVLNRDWFEEIKEKTDEEVLAFCLWQEYGKIVPDESKELANFLLQKFQSIRQDLQKLKGLK